MSPPKSKQCIAFEHHDHRLCRKQLLSAAKNLCETRKIRLTARRQQVLEILLQSHQPMGAYEILAQINQTSKESAIAPPIVYRALEFLLEEGLIHRIECKNAFIGCAHPGHQSATQFLICNGCAKVAEIVDTDGALKDQATQVGFAVDHSVIEITGFCAECQQT